MPRSAFNGDSIKHYVIRFYRSIVAANISFASGKRCVAILTHQNVVRFSRICILWSDEKISGTIRGVPTNLVIRTDEVSIDESRHFVTRLIRQFYLSSGSLRANRVSLVHNSSGIPVAKCWRNRVAGHIVDGTNRKETLFFTFNMFHRKIALGRRHGGSEKWNEARTSRKAKRDRKVARRRKQPRAIAPSIRLSIRAVAVTASISSSVVLSLYLSVLDSSPAAKWELLVVLSKDIDWNEVSHQWGVASARIEWMICESSTC